MAKVLVLDAGHGLNTSGKQTMNGSRGIVKEWTINSNVCNKIHKETLAMQQKQMENSERTIKEAQEANRLLMLSNKELLETNRTLVEGISVKVDIIENSILELKRNSEK